MMNERSKGFLALAVVLVLCGVQVLYYAPRLPDTVASHFAFDGTPNGWDEKVRFLGFYGGMILCLATVFVSIAQAMPRIPPAFINMPGKDYWLAPPRRKATLRYLASRLMAMGNVTLLFVIVLFQFTIQANLRAEEDVRLGVETLVLGGVYFAYILIWVIRLFASLRRPR